MRRVFTIVLLMILTAGVAVAAVVQTPSPEIVVSEVDEVYIIEAIGEGVVHLFKDGEEVENPCMIEMTYDEQWYYFEAYAQAEGCLPSDWAEEYVYVQSLNPPIPPTFGYSVSETDEAVILELYYNKDEFYVSWVLVNGEAQDLPFSFVFPRWEEEYEVVVNVAFSEDGYEDYWIPADCVVPALEGAPHDVDFDGSVTINDVSVLIHYLLCHISEGVNVEKADVDGNGLINIDDVTKLINRLLKRPRWV